MWVVVRGTNVDKVPHHISNILFGRKKFFAGKRKKTPAQQNDVLLSYAIAACFIFSKYIKGWAPSPFLFSPKNKIINLSSERAEPHRLMLCTRAPLPLITNIKTHSAENVGGATSSVELLEDSLNLGTREFNKQVLILKRTTSRNVSYWNWHNNYLTNSLYRHKRTYWSILICSGAIIKLSTYYNLTTSLL